MNRSTQIWVGVVVLAGLAGAVYYKAKEDSKVGTAETTNADVPEIKVGDDVDKISIQNADKPEIVLEKKGDEWQLTKPLQARANQDSVKSILGNLKDLKAKEVIVAQADEPSKKDYDFAGKGVHVVAWKGGDKKLDATFGKSGARGQMAMVEGKPGIYAVSGYSSYLYTREVKGFRDSEIFKFDDQNASSVTIDNKNGTLSFTKGGDKWAATFKGKPLERFDEDKIKDMLRTFKSLSADDFGDGKPPSETGLDKPEATVTIDLKDGAGKYVLRVGKTSSGTNRWAQKEGSELPYSILSYQAEWALAEPSKFQKPADAGAGDGGGKKDEKKAEPPADMGDPHGH